MLARIKKTDFGGKVLSWASGIHMSLKTKIALARLWIIFNVPSWVRGTFNLGFVIGLFVSIGSCISSTNDSRELMMQNRALKAKIMQLKIELSDRFDVVDEQLKYIRGQMVSRSSEEELTTKSDELSKNTLLALKKFDEGDYAAAYGYAKQGDLGNADLLFMLGWMYFEGNQVERSLKNVFQCWNKAAHAGHARAQFDLAVMYAKGEYVEKDLAKAVMWLTKAAEADLPEAAFRLGIVFEKGIGVKRSGRAALKWYGKAFELGYVHAGYHIARMYETGKCIELNKDVAKEWFLKSMEKGDSHTVGRMSMSAPIVVDKNNDIVEDSMLYRLAKRGSPIARNKIVDAYCFGVEGIQPDMAKAYKWCVEGAENGDQRFQIRAGDLCLTGGVPGKGESDAFRWYRMATENEVVDPEVFYKLGSLYMTGKGVAKDEKRAVELFTRADTENDGLEEAQVALGDAYRDGKGVEKNLDEAIKWYEKAAEVDNENALLRLGKVYENGEGGETNLVLASQYYERAIEAAFEESVKKEAQKGLIRITTKESK